MIMKSDTLKKEANVNFYKVSIKFYKLCVTGSMGFNVNDIMQKNLMTIDENELIVNAKKLLVINKLKYLIVTKNKKFLGIISNTDLVKDFDIGVTAGNCIIESKKVFLTFTTETTVKEAAQKIMENKLEFVPVLDNEGSVIGFVTPADVVKDLGTDEEKKLTPEMAVIYLAMTQNREEEKHWFERIKVMGYKAAVTQVGANAIELPVKLREGSIVAAIAKGVISEELREKNAVSNAVRDLYAQIEIINRGLGGGFKLAIIRGKDIVSVAAYGKCGHALGSGPDHIFMGYSII